MQQVRNSEIGSSQDPDPDQRERWARRLRQFHLHGPSAEASSDPSAAGPLRPALAAALADGAWHGEAVVLPEGADAPGAVPAERFVRETIARASAACGPLAILERRAEVLARALERAAADRPNPASLAEAWERALDALPAALDLSAAGAAELDKEIQALREARPGAGLVLDPGRDALPALYARAVDRSRRPLREEFAGDARLLVERLDELLRVDAGNAPEAASSGALAPALGDAGRQLLDPGALARSLPERRGSRRMSPERRRRIAGAADELRRWLAESAREPAAMLVLREDGPPRTIDLPACRVVADVEPLRAAPEWFEALAETTVRVLRAARIARLEAVGAFDELEHGPALERLDWQGLTSDELRILPAVAALESGARLRGPALAALSELLRSGLPVHVLVEEDVVAAASETRLHASLGLLAVAHREALVVQSGVARPDHLVRALARVARAVVPAVAVVAVPRRDSAVAAWLSTAAALAGRAVPCFAYDPGAGETWAERFDLDGNPQPERPWPTYAATGREDSGAERTLDESFTFAHTAALAGELRGHFLAIPPAAWSDDQVPVGEWLAARIDRRRGQLPFVWIVDEHGRLGRAAVSRALAFACLDRVRAWRSLQELAGIGNEHARRAAEAARRQALDEAAEERGRIEAAHAAELERVRAETAREAMDRLVAVLLDLDAAPAPRRAAEAPAAAAPAAPAVVPAAPAAPTEEEPLVEDPYVDSMLCTTCNECTNLNPRLFRYNGNRQATIGDPAAGTYAELIKAAEKCPARCIHPGAPRPGDPTVTDELVARARAFR